jgi:DNA-binding response OmpR family regulator
MSISLMNNPNLQAIPNLVEGKILLVDEDLQDLSFYSVVLYKQGYQVVPCESYNTALRWLESDTFDLIVVSQGGPTFEGRRVLERAVRPGRRIPVLVLTSWVDMNLYMEAMSLGAVDYLEKAADPAEIVRAIKLCLNHANQPGLPRFETTSSSDKPEGNSIDSSPSFEFGGPGDC